ncbi:rubredoxin [Edwardsiella ictaluri]|nr:rubredoxin [Edwardsiella ictaluri]WFO11427.1 rubredoxin [Edwardsiella ictaluri]WFO14334.1 rubredoxin [Edwardsiella ictaluri]
MPGWSATCAGGCTIRRRGDRVGQIPPGIPFSALPSHWRCPQCDADKLHFLLLG